MSKETYMIESLTRDMITSLMEERSLSMREAMDLVYRSHAYKSLTNLKTGLYYQSPVYLIDQLDEELPKTISV